MIDINDYLLIYKPSENKCYKIQIYSLDSMFVTIGKNPDELFDKIYSLSSYILELSAEITANFSTKKQLLETYETKQSVDDLLEDKNIMSAGDIENYIKDNNYVTIETADKMYDDNHANTLDIFDAVDNTIDGWMNQ